ncbi:AsmA-like C-terminal region-containing protein [Roseomonas eburnea]|uniref:AsmA-like C-terminal region-containing protein n=1 Tax=Neoroseomonas eburnea TaxID=1346889 RepID=A0A9X9XA65_9PROT|nr:AsmA-like C-terminal region-containing protein [Neoroseomonas eburnea]MBR0680601.1 AsmA-like C-terminal region-containing protein [Neoroseomonas eburnea]
MARFVLAVTALSGIGLGMLAWRLEQAPLPVHWLADQVEQVFNSAGGPTRLDIGDAALAWAGWREGHRSPLEITLRHVRLTDADGSVRAELPDAAISLSVPWLLRGVVAPQALEMRGLSLWAVRGGDGSFVLDLGSFGDAAGEAASPPEDRPQGSALLEMLAEMMLPPSDDTPLAALRRLRLTEARLVVVDAQLDRSWSAELMTLGLTRREGGGLDLAGVGALALGRERVPLRIDGLLDGRTRRGQVTLALPAVRPAALARAAPALGALAALDAQASLALDVRLEGLRIPSMALARLRVGPGAIDLGARGRLMLAAIEADATFDEGTLRLERAVIRPAPPRSATAGAPPLIRAAAEARQEGGVWTAEARVSLDEVAFADLPHYWPEGVARGARSWLAENVTAGTARNGAWKVSAQLDPATGALRLLGFEGSVEGEEATVHWLRPIPPAEGARARASFAADAITVDVTEGRQSGTGIAVREGRIRFGLDTDPETAEMSFRVDGPLPDVWTLLRHPRLHLFDRRPPPIAALGGTLREARLQIAFPMVAELPIEMLRLSATGRGTEVRIPRAIFGRDLERGAFDFTVDTDGLRVNGTATLAGIPLRIQQEADFRPGPANQVVARETVTARAEARQVAALVFDPRPFVDGMLGLDIRSETRRNGQGRVALRTDLTQARLAVEPLAWAKPPGIAANGEATFLLQNGALTAIDGIRVEGADALLRGRASQMRNNEPQRIEIQQAHLGRSRFTAELTPPQGRGGAWTIGMRGQVLDLAPVLAAPTAAPATAAEAAAPGVALDVRFERMLLGEDRALTGVGGSARVDGIGVVQAAELRGRVAGGGSLDLRIQPEGPRRRVHVESDDGGALLRAFGVLRTVQGGRLRVEASYPHSRPGAPLSGTAELEEFVLRDAPAFGKLLQALSVYGVFEALSGQGLNFNSLTAPFVLTREALVLDDARAFSASLGVTAKGRIDRLRQTIDMEGTIVPAYVFNSLLGRLPIFGRLFSPERGGGLFAATYRMRGPLNDPSVSVNPLAALTPGFLRGVFGIGQDSAPTGR